MARNTQSTTKAQPAKAAPKTKAKSNEAEAVKAASAQPKATVAKKATAAKPTTAKAKAAPAAKAKPTKAAPAKAKAAPKKATTAKPKTAAKAKPAKAKAAVKAKAPVAVAAVPEGYTTVTPSLIVRGAATAIEFYKTVFRAEELSRTYTADGSIVNAAIKIGTAVVQLSDEMPAYGILSPASLGAATSILQVYLEDVDAAWQRAVDAAALVLLPLEDAYWGERTGKLVDPYGQVWVLSKKVENLSEKEISERYEALVSPVVETTEVSAPVASEEDVPLVDITDAIAREAAKSAAEASQAVQ